MKPDSENSEIQENKRSNEQSGDYYIVGGKVDR